MPDYGITPLHPAEFIPGLGCIIYSARRGGVRGLRDQYRSDVPSMMRSFVSFGTNRWKTPDVPDAVLTRLAARNALYAVYQSLVVTEALQGFPNVRQLVNALYS